MCHNNRALWRLSFWLKLKTDYSEAKLFRHISLTLFCLKTLERLWLENHTQGMNRYIQIGMRPGKSAESAIYPVVSRIEWALQFGQWTCLCFLSNLVMVNETELNITPGLCCWIADTSNRKSREYTMWTDGHSYLNILRLVSGQDIDYCSKDRSGVIL